MNNGMKKREVGQITEFVLCHPTPDLSYASWKADSF